MAVYSLWTKDRSHIDIRYYRSPIYLQPDETHCIISSTDEEVVSSDLFISMDSISVHLWGEASQVKYIDRFV